MQGAARFHVMKQTNLSLALQAATDAAGLVPDTQAGRLALLEELQQIPLKIRAQQQQLQIFGCAVCYHCMLQAGTRKPAPVLSHISHASWHGHGVNAAIHRGLSHQRVYLRFPLF
jgi:hypothetical protein